ncbi:MAG: hypothetical protein ABR879_09055 [Methanomassiliicoccales archaeon]|jgi:SAM-dependent methyltransferase
MIGLSEERTAMEAAKSSSMPEELSDLVPGSPEYRSLGESIASNCGQLLSHGGTVLDLGCAKGDLIAALLPTACGNCRFVAFDKKKENVEACSDRFRWLAHEGFVTIGHNDLRSEVVAIPNRLTIDELEFGSLSDQRVAEVLSIMRSAIPKGGAIAVVERTDRPWPEVLAIAGFRDVRLIWKRGALEALMAEK